MADINQTQLDALFWEASDLEGDERVQFLEELRAENEDLAAALEDMLARFDAMEERLEKSVLPSGLIGALIANRPSGLVRPGSDTLSPMQDEVGEEEAPNKIGPYTVVRKIGQGGMGLVYLVLQSEPRRELALKLLNQTSYEFRTRFEAEYQVLALMNHPNIAAIHEVGHTQKGQVYFTMEYVDGIPITTYCQHYKLNLRQRLLLFCQVCEGVLHAHQKAVVHRDLKPTNILVANQHGKPLAKIIDFGIAKGLERDLIDRCFETQVGTLVGTLEYMSYEQLLGLGDIDTRGDIYSLGVVLYQMLADVLPLDAQSLKHASTEALLRFYREKEPPPPSQRLKVYKTQHPNHESLVTPAELVGDIDGIVLKAMEKDLNRRYGTVGEFLHDISAYLDDLPVSARAPGLGYLTVKFVRRNRLLVGSVGMVLFSLFFGLYLSIDATLRVSREKQEKEKAFIELEATLTDLKATNKFINEMIESSNPNKGKRDTKVIDVLVQAEKNLNAMKDTTEKATIMATLGSSYYGLGKYPESIALFRKALVLRTALLGADNLATLETKYLLAKSLRRGDSPENLSEAVVISENLIPDLEKVLGPSHPDTLNARVDLAFCFTGTTQADNNPVLSGNPLYAPEVLVTYLRDVYELQKKVMGPEDQSTLRTLNGLGLALINIHDFQPAAECALRAYNGQKKRLGETHPQTMSSRYNYIVALKEMGCFSEALTHAEELKHQRIQVLGKTHDLSLRTSFSVSSILVKLNRKRDAERVLFAALHDLYQEDKIDGHFGMNALEYLAECLYDPENNEEFIKLVRELMELYGEPDLGFSSHLSLLHSRSLMLQGRYGEANEFIDLLFSIGQIRRGQDTPLAVYRVLALEGLGEQAKADDLYQHILCLNQDDIKMIRALMVEDCRDFGFPERAVPELQILISEVGSEYRGRDFCLDREWLANEGYEIFAPLCD